MASYDNRDLEEMLKFREAQIEARNVKILQLEARVAELTLLLENFSTEVSFDPE